jgi:hypothetical protein
MGCRRESLDFEQHIESPEDEGIVVDEVNALQAISFSGLEVGGLLRMFPADEIGLSAEPVEHTLCATSADRASKRIDALSGRFLPALAQFRKKRLFWQGCRPEV